MLLYIMQHIMHVYLMLLAAMSNAVCLYDAFSLPLSLANAFFMIRLGLLIHSLFILNIILHYAIC